MEPKITIEFIRGWFDRSSAINQDTRSLFARSSHEQPIRSIYVVLQGLGIECSLSETGDIFELRIGRREALEKWKQLIGFVREDRTAKLDSIIASYDK